jgi:hypothetical protein
MIEKNIRGGKVIASGGFGCIFKPALKCENSNINEKRDNSRISKLMSVKHATEEFKQITKFKDILKVIPNYENYFLLDNFTLCKPDKLTKEDLTSFNRKCKALTKKNITTKNINSSLNQLLSLNMPDGGIDIEDFLDTHWSNTNIIRLNNSLIGLLVHGILPMNNLQVYHCDIKDSNVLVEEYESAFATRLIDWGLSISLSNELPKNELEKDKETSKLEKDKETSKLPKKLYRRPFQYNVPFSVILFNNEFVSRYTEFLILNTNPNYFFIREFVINYIFIWNDIRGPGHLNTINSFMKKLMFNELPAIKKEKIKEHIIEYDFTYYYIVEYISQILLHFTSDGKFHLFKYFNNVFLKNIDIWGFVMIYISMFEKLYPQFDKLNEYQMQFINKVKYIIIHFLYESPVKPIVVDDLVKELTSLNTLVEKFDLNVTPRKGEYLLSLSEKGGKSEIKQNTNKTRKRIRKIYKKVSNNKNKSKNKNNKGRTRKNK